MSKPDIVDEIIIAQEEIKEINKRLYSELFSHYKNNIKTNSKKINVFVVLQGAENFAKDLFLKKISTGEMSNPVFEIKYIRAKSYEGINSSGEVLIDFRDVVPEKDITNQHILIIDDIYDRGETLHSIHKRIKKYNPISVECCVFIERNIKHKKEVNIKFVGKKIDKKEFLIGYGLDYNGEYRELPYVSTIKEEEIDEIDENDILFLQKKIKGMKKVQQRDYQRLLQKYNTAEKNLKNNPKRCGGEKYIKGFMSGLISGMVLLDDNLQSKVCEVELEHNNIAPITPEQCLICGSKYSGGATYKGELMKEGLRVFFECGSMSFKKLDDGVFQLIVKCTKQSEIEDKND